jgi:lipopolysaccharide export system protein LptA
MSLLLVSGIIAFSTATALPTGKTRIELLNADVSEFNQEQNAAATRLIGNVRFRHESAVMNCDSAYLYRAENRLEAFGRIRMNQGDTVQLTGGRLNYDGNTRIAQVFRNIVLTDRKMTLHTERITYDVENGIASYTDSAHIVDGENVLTSRFGTYHSVSRDLYFKKDVRLTNPRYTLTCDTLRYNTSNSTAYFLGPTYIRTRSSTMYCENGWYDTGRQLSYFTGKSYLETNGQLLSGDTLQYDQRREIGKGRGNVAITDSSRKLIIRGDYAEHHRLTDSSWVVGHSEMVQFDEHDSLFLHADTLMAIGQRSESDTSARHKDIFAYHRVRVYKLDLQGTCDSLVYTFSDSTIRFYRNPVLWSGPNQLTADSIWLVTGDNRIERIHLRQNALIVSKSDTLQTGSVDSLRFNQITGKVMTGHFKENELYRIDVNGNVQTIYYAKSKKGNDVAVNRADCSELRIRVKNNEVQKITFIKDPEGTLYPLNELKTSDLRLKGFRWEETIRPKDRASIFN